MTGYNVNIIKGSPIRGERLKLARARAIYKAALRHPYVTEVSCLVNSKSDEIICLRFIRLEVPDEPIYDIHDEEEVAIICHPEDVFIPEVYALRKDFPTELPHSNARPFERPVSLCVSDVSFLDIRPQFNAFDFLNYIRRWLSLNSINNLHEANRPLEVYFAFNEVCCMLNEPIGDNPYVHYSKKTKYSSTLEFTDKSNANYYLVTLPTEKIYANNFAHIPQTIGDLKEILSTPQMSIPDSLMTILAHTIAGKAALPLMVLLFITQSSASGIKTKQNVFLLKAKCSPIDITVKQRELSKQNFEKWFFEQQIEVILLIGMVTREENARNNGIIDTFNKVSIIGTGTLGASVIDHFLREGCAEEIAIADYDILVPHNLSRHILTTDKVMTSKVRSIKDSYHGMFGQRITAIDENILMLNHNDKERFFKDTQLVVDMSTSIAVERYLAYEQQNFRRATSFLNPMGDDIVLLMEDKDRKHRLDLLEMDYYRNLIVDERFEHHLEHPGVVRTNSFSCRSESMILNYENVRALSAIVSQQLRKYYISGERCLSVWHIDEDSGTIIRNPMHVSEWRKVKLRDVEVYISSDVEGEINTMVSASPDKETGGCLFGSYDRDNHTIYVYYMVEAPADSIHAPMSFIRGSKGLTDKYRRMTKLTYHQVRYLGEWHSHPQMQNTPSATDWKLFETMSEEQQSQDLPFVMLIHGNNGLHVEAVM